MRNHHISEASFEPNMASSTPTPASRHQFLRKVEDTKISKADVNNLIMDYLITEGYPSAAKKFAIEANLQPKTDFESINERVEIRDSIHKGDLQNAIELINELNPELLETNSSLHFSLLRLQLIEFIKHIPSASDRSSATVQALEFSANLAPHASRSEAFRRELEAAMSLLIFKPEQWAQQYQYHTSSSNTSTSNGTSSSQNSQPFGVLADLVDPALRKKVAKDVNEAILQSQGQKREARIRQLVRTRAWAEKLAREKKIDLPAKLDLELDGDHLVTRTETAAGANGHPNGDTIMNDTSGGTADVLLHYPGMSRSRVEGDAALAQFTDLSTLS